MNQIAPRRFSGLRIVLLVLLAVLAFLLLMPTRVQPVAWNPAPAPSLSQGPFAENQKLKAVQPVGARDIDGPEALLLEHEQLLSGLHDGRVIQSSLDGSALKVLVNTGGRPLGLARHPDGRLIIADAIKGLLALDSQGQLQTLSTEANGLKFGFTDDVAVDAAGRYAYFSDATSRWGYGHDGEAVIEHGADGRLLRYDFQSGTTEVLLDRLEFANGIALGPDEAYVLVNETGAYRISRYWLKGDKAGSHDLFIDNLPGLPDNLSFNGAGRFWVALYAPRNPLLDATAPYPFVRKMLVRAMTVLPKPVEKRGFVLGLDTQGRVIANLQDGSSGNYSPITTVREYGDALYLGSLTARHMARLSLKEALAP
ncbi:SMP-30/gluconolactonase/LRE family protein [Pseudomonas protegens]|uniref:Strictosidine synthase family protein n=2 Tax=Pseudomonas protegens TaxID=380021 RepID=Q4KAE1_PSEF5|nr:SMP-30/gluconolactonase/LRE family protein [Pseudomonas protegens]AAY92956.1 strictosidine synthase family protein [Pseudomonas protegens Pf-5]ASE22868.2 SMP-30/gluconolactonase/LRE family protein [Pseudomonas protegens]POA83718.1 SMP-30/gluconolactonase/LRE family protein [Pseudomonas protegens]QEZ53443.1 SMP-30/gluconolactonase/LRE family protein [Pseudomonas protegens]QEZ60346.1 SMP-30/gluconolactonase/LRE family protein [Pseudomonas protegens]